jgi:MFS family permease
MNNSPESISGRATLALGHVGGMLDLIILPLWVGGMISTFAFAPQQAGIVVGLFLVGVLASNSVLARRYGRIPNRPVAGLGYSVMCLAFFAMTRAPYAGGLSMLVQIAVLHLVAGLGAGVGLSCVHGTIGRSANPHRMFAIAISPSRFRPSSSMRSRRR